MERTPLAQAILDLETYYRDRGIFVEVLGEDCWVDADGQKSEPFQTRDQHYLLYSDVHVALTMFECCYALWSVKDGKLLHGPEWMQDDTLHVSSLPAIT